MFEKKAKDTQCQTHDVDNLFVIDTSCFVSFPGHNHSRPAQAIAYASYDYIKTEWKGGAFRTRSKCTIG